MGRECGSLRNWQEEVLMLLNEERYPSIAMYLEPKPKGTVSFAGGLNFLR